jgi:high affinity Mn2+ porin
MRRKILAAALAAGCAMPAAADDMTTVLAEMKRLSARVEALEKQNKDLEKALASERISEKDPELATRVKAVETQVDAIKGPATKLAEALDGIEVEGSITAVVQKVGGRGTASGRDETRGNYRGDLTISLPVGSMGDSDGKFFTHVRLGQGDGVGLRPTYTSGPTRWPSRARRVPTIPMASSPRPGIN